MPIMTSGAGAAGAGAAGAGAAGAGAAGAGAAGAGAAGAGAAGAGAAGAGAAGAPPAGAEPTAEPVAAAQQATTSGGDIDEEEVESFLDAGYQVIYGGKSADGELNAPIANMLRRNVEDPVQGLADTAAQVASTVVNGAVNAGMSIGSAEIFASMMTLVGELASVAGEEGIYDYQQNEIDSAAVRAGEVLYGQTQDRKIYPQEEAMMEAGELVDASRSGELDQAIGMLEQADGAGPVPGPGPASSIMGRSM